ncbi:MAG: LamG-like jellyroll fold domain-containing protein [Bacteroidia bacterium]|jgi:hypothetical protein
MKKLYAFVILILANAFISSVSAQSQNALDFDGLDDQVVSVNASSLIANSSQISLSFWVYPRNPVPGFPDFDGLAGFRDNTVADFYILQYSSTAVEARFRNSAGINFDILSQGLQLNTWQQYALTYDGSFLRLFRNGLITDSVSASGVISSTATSFYLGNLVFSGTNFLLDGQMDEVALWNRALTPQEVLCIYKNKVNTTSTGLQLYYDMNTGIAGGNNSGILTIPDISNHINGVLQNFSMTGTSSNFVNGVDHATVITDTLCSGQTYSFNGQTLTQAGVYTATLVSSLNCDSIVRLTLISNDTTVNQNQAVLTAVQTGGVYQWVDCNNSYNPIPGATNQTYTATANGSYAVIITANGCSDTSACHTVVTVGIHEYSVSNWNTYPNPTVNDFTIVTNEIINNAEIIISDISGKQISRMTKDIKYQYAVDVSTLPCGSYIITLKTEKKTEKWRLIKI